MLTTNVGIRLGLFNTHPRLEHARGAGGSSGRVSNNPKRLLSLTATPQLTLSAKLQSLKQRQPPRMVPKITAHRGGILGLLEFCSLRWTLRSVQS